jgi:ATP-dependent RNA helicase DeaD
MQPSPEDLSDGPVAAHDPMKAERPDTRFQNGDWFVISVGRKQRAEPRWLLPMICKAGGVTKQAIGSIRIFDTETIFEIAADKVDSFLRSVGANGTGEKGVHINAVEGPGERPDRPQGKRRPPGPPEKYDPMKPRPEKADRKERYGKPKDDDFEAVMATPRPPREAKPAREKTFVKDKGKPKWAKPAAEGEARAPKKKSKDHKKGRSAE